MRFTAGNNRTSGQIVYSSSTDIVQAGCLKATCPGRLQPGVCRSRRKSRQCTGTGNSDPNSPRTSLSGWWLA